MALKCLLVLEMYGLDDVHWLKAAHIVVPSAGIQVLVELVASIRKWLRSQRGVEVDRAVLLFDYAHQVVRLSRRHYRLFLVCVPACDALSL